MLQRFLSHKRANEVSCRPALPDLKRKPFLYVFLNVSCQDITLLLALFTSQLILLYGTCAAKPQLKFMAIVSNEILIGSNFLFFSILQLVMLNFHRRALIVFSLFSSAFT